MNWTHRQNFIFISPILAELFGEKSTFAEKAFLRCLLIVKNQSGTEMSLLLNSFKVSVTTSTSPAGAGGPGVKSSSTQNRVHCVNDGPYLVLRGK